MKTFLRLLTFLKPFAGWVTLSIALGVLTILSNIGLLGASAYLIARAALHPSIAVLQVAIVGVRFFGISRGIFRYFERLISHSVNLRLLGRIRLWFYQRLEPLAPAALMDSHSGDLLSRSVADIETLQDFFVRVVAPPVTALVVVAIASYFVGQFHPGLAGILLAGLMAAGIGLPALSGWISRKPAQQLLHRRAILTQAMVDGLQGMPDLVSFDRSANYLERFRGINDEIGCMQRRLSWSGGLTSGLNVLIVNLSMLAILASAILLASAGKIDGVDLAVLVLVTLASFEAVSPLGPAAQQLVASLQAAERLYAVADRTPAVKTLPVPSQAPESMTILARNLSFCYDQASPFVLKDISIDLYPGKRLGIVGPSGAGKSTLLNLLLRFWDYEDGQIFLNGKDLKSYPAADIRAKTAVISQDTYLFTGSVRDNLLLACPTAAEQDLYRAIEQAQLSDWLNALPNRLDTWLGEHGVRMSGGERQRLALARALLREADLYLLDEPCSQLDPETENDLVHSLLEATAGKSVVWVSHSLAGMDAMDEILVLQRGRIVEQGSPGELLARKGIYAKMAGTFFRNLAS